MSTIPIRASFGVSLQDVIPSRKLPARIARAYVGVSVGNPNFSGLRLRALFKWIETHVDVCQLVRAGGLSRWTTMIERGVEEEAARSIAARRGERQRAELRRRLPSHSNAVF